MLTIQNTEHFRIESPSIVTIGTFDGVHLGHQKILERLKVLKSKTGLKTVVLTFEPHPRKVLFPEQKDLRLLTLVDEKLALLEKNDVDVAVVFPFTPDFSESDAEHYIGHILVKQLNVKHLVIGYDHKFGKNRKGDIRLLREYAPRFGYTIDEIKAEDIDDIAVSSTRIRKALEEGHITLATEFLGHYFFVTGKVVKGKQLGRELGFPTANIETASSEKMLPKTGVYFVSVEVFNKSYFGMVSVGYNPTTDSDRTIKTEVNIFDFDADIYGKVVKLNFLKRLRDEKKFANLTELKAAIESDREACLQLITAQKW